MENKELIEGTWKIIVRSFKFVIAIIMIVGAYFLTSMFWKSLGYETIKNETVTESLEVIDKDEKINSVWNGKSAVTTRTFYITVERMGCEYEIKVQGNFWVNVEIGDYVECKIITKEKENGYKVVNVGLNYQ